MALAKDSNQAVSDRAFAVAVMQQTQLAALAQDLAAAVGDGLEFDEVRGAVLIAASGDPRYRQQRETAQTKAEDSAKAG